MFTDVLSPRRFTAAAILFLALAATVVAQTGGTGALSGTVSDSTGGVVANAKVTATSADTGQARTATTAGDGTYNLSLLPPGNYRLRIEATGFKVTEIPTVTVSVTETAVLDSTLEVGAATQTVTVESAVETVQTTNSTLGTVANARTVAELPLNTRNYTNLLTMTAGANSAVTNASTLGKGSPLILVNGGGAAQNTYLQDGVIVNNWYSFNTGVEGVAFGSFAIPPPDAITEFKIQTSTYDAGYGRGPGANVNVVTRTGTNAFHGTGFEFFRNTKLNANDWFRNFANQPRGVLNSHQYGGVFGGPVKKDKLFFFVSYQETGQKNGLSGYGLSNLTLPPVPDGDRGACPVGWSQLSQCNPAAQAFVPALAEAICPAKHPTAAGDATSLQGGINILCPSSGAGGPLYNLNPVAINILQLKLSDGSYALKGSGLSPTGTAGGYGLRSFSDPAIFKDHNGMGSFDYVISSKHVLAGRYQYERDPLQAPFPVLNANLAGNYLPGFPISTTKGNHASLLKLTSILSANLVNEAHMAFQRYDVINSIGTSLTDSQVGIRRLDPNVDVLSFFTIGSNRDGFQFGGQYQFGGVFHNNQYVWGDQVSWTRGKHTFRAGGEFEYIRFAQNYPSRSIGGPTFTRFADFLIGRASCQAFTGTGTCSASNPGDTNGSAAASNVNNVGTFTSANAGNIHYLFHAVEFNGFVQDDFKITPRLTLNLGVRWEYDGYPTEAKGTFSELFPSLVATSPVPPQCPTLVGGQCTTAAGTLVGMAVPNNYAGILPAGVTRSNNNGHARDGAPWNDLAPRVGFAWQPTGSSRWVLRGGAGMFYDLIGGSTYLGVTSISTPGLGQPQINGLSLATLANPWVVSPAIPAGPGLFGFKPRWVNPGASPASSDLTVSSIAEDITVPVTYEWNMNTQWEFVRSWVLEVGYVGSHGIHQAAQQRPGLQGQAANITGLNIAPLAGPDCASCQLLGVTTNTVQNVILRVPNLGINAQNPIFATKENYKFNSLQVTVRKQLSHGLQMQASYTWSRAFITQPFGINTAPYLAHFYEPNNNYRPQRLVINYLWNLPTGHPKGALRHLVADWSLSGVTTIQGGQNLSITDTLGSIFFGGAGLTGSTGNICPGKTYPDLLSSGSLQDRVTSGLSGGTGYFTETSSKANGILCATPAIGNGRGFGNMGGGVVLGPGQNNWDMALAKLFTLHEANTLQFRAEFFNTFNHTQFATPGVVANQATFGQITSTSVSPRVIQLALKYSF